MTNKEVLAKAVRMILSSWMQIYGITSKEMAEFMMYTLGTITTDYASEYHLALFIEMQDYGKVQDFVECHRRHAEREQERLLLLQESLNQ